MVGQKNELLRKVKDLQEQLLANLEQDDSRSKEENE